MKIQKNRVQKITQTTTFQCIKSKSEKKQKNKFLYCYILKINQSKRIMINNFFSFLKLKLPHTNH